MIPIRLYEKNVVGEIKNSIINNRENLFYFTPEKTCVFSGFNNKIAYLFCVTNDIPIIDVNNYGGVIISGEGSLAVGHLSKDLNNPFNKMFTRHLCDFLASKGLSVSVSNNDILIDETYKVASSSARQIGDILFSAFHISYEVNLELIKLLCTKPMQKIPKGLIDYGITKDEILSVFYNYAYSI